MSSAAPPTTWTPQTVWTLPFWKGSFVSKQHLDRVTVVGGRTHNLTFSETKFTKGKWQQVTLDQTIWERCTLNGTWFDRTYFSRVNEFINSTLTGVRFQQCSGTLVFENSALSDCTFPGTEIQWMRMHKNTRIRRCDWSTAIINRASFEEQNPFDILFGKNNWRGMVIHDLQFTKPVVQMALLVSGVDIRKGVKPWISWLQKITS